MQVLAAVLVDRRRPSLARLLRHVPHYARGDPMPAFTVSRLLVLIALVLFLLEAFHVGLGGIEMIGLGLAVYMASHLVP